MIDLTPSLEAVWARWCALRVVHLIESCGRHVIVAWLWTGRYDLREVAAEVAESKGAWAAGAAWRAEVEAAGAKHAVWPEVEKAGRGQQEKEAQEAARAEIAEAAEAIRIHGLAAPRAWIGDGRDPWLLARGVEDPRRWRAGGCDRVPQQAHGQLRRGG